MAFPGEIKQKLDPRTVMVAIESFSCQLPYGPDGRRTDFDVIKGKTRVAASHPLVVSNPQYWEPVEAGMTYRMEETGGPRSGQPRG